MFLRLEETSMRVPQSEKNYCLFAEAGLPRTLKKSILWFLKPTSREHSYVVLWAIKKWNHSLVLKFLVKMQDFTKLTRW